MYRILNMNLAELGEAFRQARIAANLTQRQVAALSGVPRGRISLFETGMLPELGAVKMLSLFDAVGLEILARRRGHQRTLDDVLSDPEEQLSGSGTPRRVRLRAAQRLKTTGGKP
jgi:transcriptional regulator with XRE-family HTH domain